MKKCKECGIEKPTYDYYKHKYSKDRLMYVCKSCWLIRCKVFRDDNPNSIKISNKNSYLKKREERIRKQKIYSENNKEKIKAYSIEYKKKNPEYSRRTVLSKYGLLLSDFYSMLESQNNSCAICGTKFIKKSDAKLDHDHITNKHRELLCNGCNTSLGLMKENKEYLLSMVRYIKKWEQ